MNKIIFVQMQHVMLCGTLYATNSSSFEFGRDKSAWWHLELRSGHNRAVVRGGAEGALAPMFRNLDVQKREQKEIVNLIASALPPRIWKHNDGSAMANPCSLFYCQFLLGDNLFRKKARHSWCYSASYHQSVSSKTLSGIFSFICFIILR